MGFGPVDEILYRRTERGCLRAQAGPVLIGLVHDVNAVKLGVELGGQLAGVLERGERELGEVRRKKDTSDLQWHEIVSPSASTILL